MTTVKSLLEINKTKNLLRCQKMNIHNSFIMVLCLFMLLSLFTSCLSEPKGNTLYVAVNGDDNNKGTTIDMPLKSVQRALELIQDRASKEVEDSFEINIREGVYELSDRIVIDHRYNLKSLSIKAYNQEEVVFSGGRSIEGTWEAKGDNIWEIPFQGTINQMFAGNKRMTRARWPNIGEYVRPEKVEVTEKWISFADSIPINFTVTDQTELLAYAAWHFVRQKIQSYDLTDNSIHTKTELGPECSSTKVMPQDRVYFENNIEFLDSEGEWFLNEDTDVLSLYTAADPNDTTYYYAVLETLFEIKGDKSRPISNISFEGLTFQYTSWQFPQEERKGIQAGFWGTHIGQPVFSPPAAIMTSYSKNCEIVDCSFFNLGEGAIALENGVAHMKIVKNTFQDIGSNVIQIGRISNYIGEGHPLHLDYKDERDAPAFNVVTNNHLKDVSTVDKGGVGILIAYSNNNKISNNLIEEVPYTGISVGWRWGNDGLLTNAHHNEISYNEIRKCMQYLSDGGAVYTVGNQPGTVVQNNWIYDIGGSGIMAEGIYADEGSGSMVISNNYVHDIQDHDYKGHRNLWETMTVENNGCNQCENPFTIKNERVRYSDFPDNKPSNTTIYGVQSKQ